MKKIYLLMIFYVAFFWTADNINAAGKEKDVTISKEDEEVIKLLELLENYEILEQDLGFVQEYENIEQISLSGENDE